LELWLLDWFVHRTVVGLVDGFGWLIDYLNIRVFGFVLDLGWLLDG